MRLVGFLLALLMVTPAIGQVDHEKQYKTNDPIILKLKELPAGQSFVEWQATWMGTENGKEISRPAGARNFPSNMLGIWEKPGRVIGRATIVVTEEVEAKDGSFVKAVVPFEGGRPFATWTFDFLISDKMEEIQPPSPPSPPIDNKVDIPGAWVLLIEETGDRSVATAAIANASAYWDGLKSRQLNYRFYDYDQKEAESYRSHVDKVGGVPALVVLNPTGKMLLARKLPANITELDKAVKETTGR